MHVELGVCADGGRRNGDGVAITITINIRIVHQEGGRGRSSRLGLHRVNVVHVIHPVGAGGSGGSFPSARVQHLSGLCSFNVDEFSHDIVFALAAVDDQVDGRLALERDEAEPSAVAGMVVVHDLRVRDGAELAEIVDELIRATGGRQAAHEHLLVIVDGVCTSRKRRRRGNVAG